MTLFLLTFFCHRDYRQTVSAISIMELDGDSGINTQIQLQDV